MERKKEENEKHSIEPKFVHNQVEKIDNKKEEIEILKKELKKKSEAKGDD